MTQKSFFYVRTSKRLLLNFSGCVFIALANQNPVPTLLLVEIREPLRQILHFWRGTFDTEVSFWVAQIAWLGAVGRVTTRDRDAVPRMKGRVLLKKLWVAQIA